MSVSNSVSNKENCKDKKYINIKINRDHFPQITKQQKNGMNE